jgi:uncharacterized protein (UPF0332 family)
MQKLNLKKLVKLNVIQSVDPSINLRKSYLEKSDESISSSKILYKNKQYNDAIALSYFSMYNSLLALLFSCGIKSENHNASIFLLKEIFDIDNSEIKTAKVERKDKQYYPSFSTNEKEVSNAIKISEKFNSEIEDFIEKLTSDKIKGYHIKFKSLIK